MFVFLIRSSHICFFSTTHQLCSLIFQVLQIKVILLTLRFNNQMYFFRFVFVLVFVAEKKWTPELNNKQLLKSWKRWDRHPTVTSLRAVRFSWEVLKPRRNFNNVIYQEVMQWKNFITINFNEVSSLMINMLLELPGHLQKKQRRKITDLCAKMWVPFILKTWEAVNSQ